MVFSVIRSPQPPKAVKLTVDSPMDQSNYIFHFITLKKEKHESVYRKFAFHYGYMISFEINQICEF